MRILCMDGPIRNIERKGLLFFFLLDFSAAGCSRPAVVVDKCGEEFEAIVKAVSANPEIRGYAVDFFSENLPMVWEKNGGSLSACPNASMGALTNSSSPSFRRDHPYVLINRIYFDNDAAFVDLHFRPSGKNVDAFMRKRNGVWEVVEKEMWEE